MVTSTNRDALPVTKTEALRHFILGMKQPLHLETISSGSESVTVYIQSFTFEPKIKYPCDKRGTHKTLHPPRAIPLLDISQRFGPQNSLPCILLDAQTDFLRREARQTSMILV